MVFIKESYKVRERNLLLNLLSENGWRSIEHFQSELGLLRDGIFGNKSYSALYNHLLSVEELSFDDYVKEETKKQMIVWHHSAGWDNSRRMFASWQRDKRGRVATSIGINDDGKVYKGFDERFWAHHLGVDSNHFGRFNLPNVNKYLNRISIGVEVCNAGYLDSDTKESYFDWRPPEEKILALEYKGREYYEKYTDQEIKSLRIWTILNAIRYNIPLYYRGFDMWELSRDALTGVSGLYTHNSFRTDKSDVSPQPHLIKMAKELELLYT